MYGMYIAQRAPVSHAIGNRDNQRERCWLGRSNILSQRADKRERMCVRLFLLVLVIDEQSMHLVAEPTLCSTLPRKAKNAKEHSNE